MEHLILIRSRSGSIPATASNLVVRRDSEEIADVAVNDRMG